LTLSTIRRFGSETCAIEIACPDPPPGVAGRTIPVSWEVASVEPRPLLAVTLTRSTPATSALVAV